LVTVAFLDIPYRIISEIDGDGKHLMGEVETELTDEEKVLRT
jgi:hypothetical protein